MENQNKWYNKKGYLWLSILFWPLTAYGLYNTEIVSKKSKYIILLSFIGLILIGLFIPKPPNAINNNYDGNSSGGVQCNCFIPYPNNIGGGYHKTCSVVDCNQKYGGVCDPN